jgi:hypothetical protein
MLHHQYYNIERVPRPRPNFIDSYSQTTGPVARSHRSSIFYADTTGLNLKFSQHNKPTRELVQHNQTSKLKTYTGNRTETDYNNLHHTLHTGGQNMAFLCTLTAVQCVHLKMVSTEVVNKMQQQYVINCLVREGSKGGDVQWKLKSTH